MCLHLELIDNLLKKIIKISFKILKPLFIIGTYQYFFGGK